MADMMVKTRAALENPTPEGLRPRLEWLFHDPSLVTDEVAEVRTKIWGAPDYQASANRRMTIDSLWPELPELGKRTSTLFLWTANNPGTHLSTAQRACELTPNAQIKVIQRCGHWPQWEKADEFNDILVDFLLAK